MRRWLGLWVLSCAVTSAAGARAQDAGTSGMGEINVNLMSDLGDAMDPVTADDCASGMLEFELTNVPTDEQRVVVFEGDNCNRINPESGTGREQCAGPLAEADIVGTQLVRVNVPAQAICDAAGASDVDARLWFLAVEETNDEVTTNQYGTFSVKVDLEPPAMPTGLTGGSGENSIRIDWDDPPNPLEIEAHELYFQVVAECEVGSGFETSTGTLQAGASPSELAAAVDNGELIKTTLNSKGGPADFANLEVGETAVVGITARDEFGNESPLSATVCASALETVGFTDEFCADRGLSEEECGASVEGCGCSTPGRSREGGAAWWAAVGLCLSLVLWARQRRRRLS